MDLTSLRDLMIPLPPLVAAIACISFALLIFLASSIRNTGYSLILLFGAAWNIGVFLLFYISDRAFAFLTVKLVYAAIIWLIAVTYMQLAARTNRQLLRQRIVILLALSATVILLLPGAAFIGSVKKVAYTPHVTHFYGLPGAYYWVFLAYLGVVLFLTVTQVWRTSVDDLSARLLLHRKYLYGSSGLVLLVSLNDILPYLSVHNYPTTTIPIYPFGSVAAITWPVLIYYAELKYGLLALPPSAHKAVRFVAVPSLLTIVTAYCFWTGLEYLDNPRFFIFALTALALIATVRATIALRKLGLRSDLPLFTGVSDLSFHLLQDLEMGGELRNCIHTILRNVSRVGSCSTAYFLSPGETYHSANVFRMSSTGELIESFLPNFALSSIPFRDARDVLVSGFDFPRRTVLALKKFLGNTSEANLWLQHNCSGRLLGITTFTLPNNRPGLVFSEEVTLSLVARQVGFALDAASSVSRMIQQNRELDTYNGMLRSENLTLVGSVHAIQESHNGSSAERDQVTTVFAHDLRTCVSLLQIDLSRLREGDWSVTHQLAPALDRLRDDLRFISEVANDMTLFSSPSAILNSADRAPAAQILDAVLKRYEGCSYEEMSVAYHCSIDIACPRRFLELILLNLIDNAVKASRHSGDGRIWIEMSCSGSDLRIKVCDNGKGLTERQRERLFLPSLRFPEISSDTKFDQGTGLGLSIVDRLVKEAEGRISVCSMPGLGSQFEVLIPVAALRLPIGRSNASFSV